MKPFEIIPVPEHVEDNKLCSPPGLRMVFNKITYSTIWADGRITFNPQLDYFTEEVEYFLKVSSMFYSFFNNIKNKNNENQND